MWKIIPQICAEKHLSSRPSCRLLITFLPEKQRPSPANNFNSPSVCDENKSLWRSALLTETSVNWSEPRKQPSSLRVRESHWQGGHVKHFEKTLTSSSWCVPSLLFWIRSTGVLYELHWCGSTLQLLGSVWTNNGWQTTAEAIMRHLCVKRAN